MASTEVGQSNVDKQNDSRDHSNSQSSNGGNSRSSRTRPTPPLKRKGTESASKSSGTPSKVAKASTRSPQQYRSLRCESDSAEGSYVNERNVDRNFFDGKRHDIICEMQG